MWDLDVDDNDYVYTFQCTGCNDLVKVGKQVKVIGKLIIVEGVMVQVVEVM